MSSEKKKKLRPSQEAATAHELQHICFVPWIGDGTAMNDHGDMILVTYFFLLVTYFFLLVTNELLLVTYK